MAAKKGTMPPAAGKGRKKGSKNKIPTDLKQLVMDTLARLEKEKKGLYDEAKGDPKWFFEHFLKPLLPKTVSGSIDLNLDESLRKEAFQLLKDFKKGG